MKALLLASLLLTACSHTQIGVNNAQSGATANARVRASNGVAAVIIGGMLISANASDSSDTATPEMDPDRAINEQDCTKPVDLSGNLRCR